MGGLLILAGIVMPTLLWAEPHQPQHLDRRPLHDRLRRHRLRRRLPEGREEAQPRPDRAAASSTSSSRSGSSSGCRSTCSRAVDPATYSTRVIVPFFKTLMPDLGLLYIPFAVLCVVFASNAVNLTDGLDGLAIGTTLIAAAAFTVPHLRDRPPPCSPTTSTCCSSRASGR